MRTMANEQIFAAIAASGILPERELMLLKRRCNAAGKDIFDYSLFDKIVKIRILPEQGEKGLKWLKKFIRKDGSSDIYGYREIEIINNATVEDFTFKGFYDAGNFGHHRFVPYYELNGMEYVPLKEPYIVG